MDTIISIDDPKLKRQLSDDTVIQRLNRHFITLQSDEVKKNNYHLQEAMNNIIENMKKVNSLFEKTYQRMFFGGSFYKKTKISNPREFDLNIIIKLPFQETTVSLIKSSPGFIKLYLRTGFELSNYTPGEQKILNDLLIDGVFLSQERFRAWIEGTITKALRLLPEENGEYSIINDSSCKIYKVTKSGPAFTFALNVDDNVTISVDLVPVLEFSVDLPYDIQRKRIPKCACEVEKWLAVPKPLMDNNLETDRLWRVSFYDQERRILSNYGRIKLIIRLIKKLRDAQGWHGLKSYYIETLFFHEIETMKDEIDRRPLTLLFFMMLHKLRIAFLKREICFYWNPECNLLDKRNAAEVEQMKNRLSRILKDIENKIEFDKYIIARYILNTDEYCSLMLQAQENLNPSVESKESNEEAQWKCNIL